MVICIILCFIQLLDPIIQMRFILFSQLHLMVHTLDFLLKSINLLISFKEGTFDISFLIQDLIILLLSLV